MSLLQELEYERNKYYRLLDDVNSIYANLEKCIDNLDNADLELAKYYLVNDEGADEKKINNTISNITSTSEVLKETIIPAINNKITQLNNDIGKLNNDVTKMQDLYEGF